MGQFRIEKVIGSLPNPLDSDTLYLVRTGAGFDLYASDTTGTIAYKVNDEVGAGGGGGDKAYGSFYLTTGGVTGVSNTKVTLVLNATAINSGDMVLASNQVTINKDGNFKFDMECYFNTGSSSRSEFTIWLEKNNVEVPGTRTGTYQRGYDSGDTASMSIIIPVVSGNVFRLRTVRTDGGATTGYQDNNGTRLNIVEV